MFPHEESLVPIFVWQRGREHPEQIGTGIYVHLGDKAYFLTAGHVVDQRDHGSLYVPGAAGMVGLDGGVGGNSLRANVDRQHDKFDVAFVRLNDETKAQLHPSFAPLSKKYVDLQGYAPPGTPCSVGGYPITKAKRTFTEYQSATYSYVGTAAEHETYRALGYDPAMHVVVHYRMKYSVFPEGDRTNPPHPRGLSGGGIFRLQPSNLVDISYSPRTLVASMHTFLRRENCFVGTRIPGYFQLIRLRFPDEMRAFAED